MNRSLDAPTIELTLRSLLAELPGGDVELDPDDDGPDSIRRLGLSSGRLLAFLVAVEDAFGFSWDDDLDPAILASFDSMAAYLADRLAAEAA